MPICFKSQICFVNGFGESHISLCIWTTFEMICEIYIQFCEIWNNVQSMFFFLLFFLMVHVGERIDLLDKHQDFNNGRQFILSNSFWTIGFRYFIGNQNTTQSGARGVWLVEFHSFTHEQTQSIRICSFQLCIFSPSSGYILSSLKQVWIKTHLV